MLTSQTHTVEELTNIIDNYMYNDVDGDAFKHEIDFENAIRDMLLNEGFNVLPKHNVRNTNKIIQEQRVFGNPDKLIPDIAIVCDDASVFLELKLCNEDGAYDEDINKANLYLAKSKCDVAGVLFLDNESYVDWEECQGNSNYNYLFELYQPTL